MKSYRTTLAPLVSIFIFAAASHAQSTFKYLEDEAESGGFDVTGEVKSLPADMILAQQENGDGYVLHATANRLEFGQLQKSKESLLGVEQSALKPGPVVVQRRGQRWRVISGGRVMLQVEDDKWHEGKIGQRGGWGELKVQPVEEIKFDDDFMRVAQEVAMATARTDPKSGVRVADVKVQETVWTVVAGTWSTTGLSENPNSQVAQSANPFGFQSSGTGVNLALAGRPFWSDYEAQVSVKPHGAQAIGLAVYAQDAKNYLLLHWKESGQLQLRGVINGETKVLDGVEFPYEQQQWYRLRVSITSGLLQAFIDDNEMLRARTGYFGRGEVGVYAECADKNDYAFFDDVSVRSSEDLQDDFRSVVPGRWETVAGRLNINNAARPMPGDGALAVAGQQGWHDYATSGLIQLPADTVAGLVLNHQSGHGAYLLRVGGSRANSPIAGKTQIYKIATAANGSKTAAVIAEVKTGSQFDDKQVEWRFSYDHGYLSASVVQDGVTRRLLDAFDESLPAGRAGFHVQRGAKGVPAVHSMAVEFPRERATWGKVPELYELDMQATTMGGWSTPEGLWSGSHPLADVKATTVVAPATVSNPSQPTAASALTTASAKLMWHKGAFWGDDSIRFKLPALTAGQQVTVVFGELGDSAKPSDKGSFAVTFQADKNVLTASIALAGLADGTVKLSQPPAATAASYRSESKFEGAVEKQVVTVERRGSYIILRLAAPDAQAKTLLATRISP